MVTGLSNHSDERPDTTAAQPTRKRKRKKPGLKKDYVNSGEPHVLYKKNNCTLFNAGANIESAEDVLKIISSISTSINEIDAVTMDNISQKCLEKDGKYITKLHWGREILTLSLWNSNTSTGTIHVTGSGAKQRNAIITQLALSYNIKIAVQVMETRESNVYKQLTFDKNKNLFVSNEDIHLVFSELPENRAIMASRRTNINTEETQEQGNHTTPSLQDEDEQNQYLQHPPESNQNDDGPPVLENNNEDEQDDQKDAHAGNTTGADINQSNSSSSTPLTDGQKRLLALRELSRIREDEVLQLKIQAEQLLKQKKQSEKEMEAKAKLKRQEEEVEKAIALELKTHQHLAEQKKQYEREAEALQRQKYLGKEADKKKLAREGGQDNEGAPETKTEAIVITTNAPKDHEDNSASLKQEIDHLKQLVQEVLAHKAQQGQTTSEQQQQQHKTSHEPSGANAKPDPKQIRSNKDIKPDHPIVAKLIEKIINLVVERLAGGKQNQMTILFKSRALKYTKNAISFQIMEPNLWAQNILKMAIELLPQHEKHPEAIQKEGTYLAKMLVFLIKETPFDEGQHKGKSIAVDKPLEDFEYSIKDEFIKQESNNKRRKGSASNSSSGFYNQGTIQRQSDARQFRDRNLERDNYQQRIQQHRDNQQSRHEDQFHRNNRMPVRADLLRNMLFEQLESALANGGNRGNFNRF